MFFWLKMKSGHQQPATAIVLQSQHVYMAQYVRNATLVIIHRPPAFAQLVPLLVVLPVLVELAVILVYLVFIGFHWIYMMSTGDVLLVPLAVPPVLLPLCAIPAILDIITRD